MSKKLFVGNLNFQATADEIRDAFAAYGEVQKVNLVSDAYSGRSRGFAFVEMVSDESADKAREALNGFLFRERKMTVDWARPEPRNGNGGGGSFARREMGQGQRFGR